MKFRILSCFLVVFILFSAIPAYAIDNANKTSEHVFTKSELAGESFVDTTNMLLTSDGFVPINQIENNESRASTTYYIAEMNDGYLLTSPTSGTFSKTRYSAGNSNSHNLQKWIFTEDSNGDYIVYSNTDSTKCLTVNPTTCSVTLATYSGSQYQKWGMYYSGNGNALQSEATDTAVSGHKLVINSSTCFVSDSTYTPVGFIDVSWFVPCSSIAVRDMAVAVNDDHYMYSPTYTPSNSTCNGNNWLTYTSGNTSVCTINSSGLVTGRTIGTATISIVHKITRATGSFTVRVLNPLTYDARLYYDSGSPYSADTLSLIYSSATNDINRAYCIDFNLVSTSVSGLLNGNECPNTTAGNICTTSCGAHSSCSTKHHKSASRLLNLLSSSSYYTYRLVSHAVCRYSDGSHNEIVGLGNRPGRNALTSMESTPNLERSIQHELTHNLGGSHTTCNTSQKCVLNGDYGYRCDNCRSAILNERG